MDDLEAMRHEILTPSMETTRPDTDKVSYIQTDLFCEGCGYNLKGQRVWRDERLGFFICRCPECAKHAVPGPSSSAVHPWLARLSWAVMLFWVLFLLALAALAVYGLVRLQWGYLSVFTGDVPGVSGRITVFVHPAGSVAAQKIAKILFVSLILCFGLGAAISVFLWRLPRGWYFWGLLLPAVIAGVVLLVWRLQVDNPELLTWGINRLLFLSLLQGCALGLGIIVGRPLTRRIVHLLFTPQMLYFVDFLWTVDEKPLPPRLAAEMADKSRV